MKISELKSKAGNTLVSVVASVSIAGAMVPQAVELAKKAAAAENAARLNSAVSYYTASGGRIPLGSSTEEVIALLQSDAPIPHFHAHGPWIHQQTAPKFVNTGWRVIKAEEGDFRVINSETPGQLGFAGF